MNIYTDLKNRVDVSKKKDMDPKDNDRSRVCVCRFSLTTKTEEQLGLEEDTTHDELKVETCRYFQLQKRELIFADNL